MQGNAEVEESHRIIRFQRERCPVSGDRLIELSVRAEGQSEVVMGFGLLGTRGDGASNQLNGDVASALLMHQNAEVLKRAGVLRLLRENFAVGTFRVRQPS